MHRVGIGLLSLFVAATAVEGASAVDLAADIATQK